MFPNMKLVRHGLFAALALALAVPALAAADAPDVTSAAGSIVKTDALGNTTVEVHGTWAWSTHTNSDCNGDKRGIGVAIDWGDNNGNHVTTLNGDSIDVGVAVATALNLADNVAHPAEPGTDIADPSSSSSWRGGCGVYANHGATSYNSGTWGPLQHVFAPGAIPEICALTYDVHLAANAGAPTGDSEVTGGANNHNADNSAEKNGSHVVGNICAQVKGLPKGPPPPGGGSPPAQNPAISIDKTGPATAVAGSPVPYLLVITNIGNVSFDAAKVVVADPLCSAAPTLIDPGGKNGDTTPNTFDPGESWYYTCSVPTAAGQTAAIHNVATVTATPAVGAAVSDDDPADTTLSQPQQPAQAVLPLLPGSARLRGPAGCLAGGPHKLVVSGRRIRTVTFFLDGKKVATRTKADKHGRFTYTVNRRHLRSGIHTIVARVTYLPETVGGSRTFRRTFAKCARALKPEFTG
jgi:hypothetical protein